MINPVTSALSLLHSSCLGDAAVCLQLCCMDRATSPLCHILYTLIATSVAILYVEMLIENKSSNISKQGIRICTISDSLILNWIKIQGSLHVVYHGNSGLLSVSNLNGYP